MGGGKKKDYENWTEDENTVQQEWIKWSKLNTVEENIHSLDLWCLTTLYIIHILAIISDVQAKESSSRSTCSRESVVSCNIFCSIHFFFEYLYVDSSLNDSIFFFPLGHWHGRGGSTNRLTDWTSIIDYGKQNVRERDSDRQRERERERGSGRGIEIEIMI